MRPLTLAALGAVTTLALTACASGAGPDANDVSGGSARQCFYPSQATNFREGDVQSLYVRSGRDEVFELQSTGFCRDIDSALSIAIQPLYSAGDRLCTGDDAAILTGGSNSGPCRVRVVKKLTAEEVAALPSRQRP